MKVNTNQTNISSVTTNHLSTHLKSILICILPFILLLFLPESALGQTHNTPSNVPGFQALIEECKLQESSGSQAVSQHELTNGRTSSGFTDD